MYGSHGDASWKGDRCPTRAHWSILLEGRGEATRFWVQLTSLHRVPLALLQLPHWLGMRESLRRSAILSFVYLRSIHFVLFSISYLCCITCHVRFMMCMMYSIWCVWCVPMCCGCVIEIVHVWYLRSAMRTCKMTDEEFSWGTGGYTECFSFTSNKFFVLWVQKSRETVEFFPKFIEVRA